METFFQRAAKYLKEWPAKFVELIRSPQTSIASLPTEGKWEIPAVYAGTAVIFSALCSFISVARYAFSYAFSAFFGFLIIAAIVFPIGVFLFNAIVGFFGRDPGLYRSALFLTTLALLGPVSVLLSLIHPVLALLPTAVYIYALYHYVQVAGAWTMKKAQVLAAILGVITFGQYLVLPMVGRYQAGKMAWGSRELQRMQPPSGNEENGQAAKDGQAAQMEQTRQLMEAIKRLEESQQK